jgi:uncharacterized protein
MGADTKGVAGVNDCTPFLEHDRVGPVHQVAGRRCNRRRGTCRADRLIGLVGNRRGTPEFAAISAAAQHHNAISKTLSTNPDRFEPIHQRKPNGDVDARPWCLGFHAAMRSRISAWAPLLDTRNVNHGLLLPILIHCDDQGRPLLGPTNKARQTEQFLRNAHGDIPAAVEAMRQYWMPIRYARAG